MPLQRSKENPSLVRQGCEQGVDAKGDALIHRLPNTAVPGVHRDWLQNCLDEVARGGRVAWGRSTLVPAGWIDGPLEKLLGHEGPPARLGEGLVGWGDGVLADAADHRTARRALQKGAQVSQVFQPQRRAALEPFLESAGEAGVASGVEIPEGVQVRPDRVRRAPQPSLQDRPTQGERERTARVGHDKHRQPLPRWQEGLSHPKRRIKAATTRRADVAGRLLSWVSRSGRKGQSRGH